MGRSCDDATKARCSLRLLAICLAESGRRGRLRVAALRTAAACEVWPAALCAVPVDFFAAADEVWPVVFFLCAVVDWVCPKSRDEAKSKTLPNRTVPFKVHLLSREKSAPDNGFYSLFLLYDETLCRFGLIYRQSRKCFQSG